MPDTAPSNAPSPGSPVSASLGGAVRSMSLVTLLSRLFGLIRDLVIVRLFGDSAVGSAFAAAFAIPNMFRRLLGEGALSAAFIPEYARAVEAEERGSGRNGIGGESDGLATLVVAALGVVTVAVTLAVEGLLLGLLLFTGPDTTQRLSITLIMAMLPFMPLVCVTAILAGMLQVRGRMGLSMTGPIFLNTFVVIVGGWRLMQGRIGEPSTAYLLAAVTVVSGLTQAVTFAWALRRNTRWVRVGSAAWRSAVPAAKRAFKRFVPVVIGTGTLQLNAFLDMLIAMWPIWIGVTVLGVAYPLDERSNAILAFTTRLYQFPLGVFGIAVATAAFPMLARTASDGARFVETLRRGIRLSLYIGLPASAGLFLVRTDLVGLLFGQWGSGGGSGGGGGGGG
ncbi:MAG: oligosaccharide flippase family protein, partial [Phycisphaeraceae bacterium]|nr:oligosaccharide flippase family protein [Phycisphaeraceae bacterium]